MTNQPKHTPTCCGQQAKWVEQTPSLAYFYCEKCKTEPGTTIKSLEDDLKYTNDFYLGYGGSVLLGGHGWNVPAGPSYTGRSSVNTGAQTPPPTTTTTTTTTKQWQIGDRALYVSTQSGPYEVRLLSGPSATNVWLVSRTFDGLQLWLREKELISMPTPPPNPTGATSGAAIVRASQSTSPIPKTGPTTLTAV